MHRRSREALVAVLLCAFLGSASAFWTLSGVLHSFQSLPAELLRSTSRQQQSRSRTTLALTDRSAKRVLPVCPSSDLVCPGCMIVGSDAAAASLSGTCAPGPGWPASQVVQCREQQLSQTARDWLQQGQCHKACTIQAEQLCTGHRSLLQQGAPPPPNQFLPAPEAPVSFASPFEAFDGLALGPALPTNASLQTVRWQCGTTLLTADTYHMLRIAVQGTYCNGTVTPEVYICGSLIVDQSTYDAVVNGSCQLAPCGASASCSSSPAPAPAPTPTLTSSACPNSVYLCGSSEASQVTPGLYTAVLASSGCNSSSDGASCTVGGYIVDLDLYSTIKAGPCKQTCPVPAAVPCAAGGAPAQAPGLAGALLCPGATYVCSNQTVQPAIYESISAASSCQSPVIGSCKVGGSLVDATLFNAVKAGNCQQSCPGSSGLPCLASAPAISPASSASSSSPPSPTTATALPLPPPASTPPSISPPASAQAPCSKPAYQCGNVTAAPTLYSAIRFSSGCNQQIQGSCSVGSTLVDLSLFNAIKYGDCKATCLDGVQAPCSVSAPPGASPSEVSCNSTAYTCGALQDIQVQASLYQAIVNATQCIPIGDGACLAGSSVIQNNTWAAIRAGTCTSDCSASSKGPTCPGSIILPSTGTPVTVTVTLPPVIAQGSPTFAPAPSSCTVAEVVCQGQDTFHLAPDLYTAISTSSNTCNMAVWSAVKDGKCATSCLQDAGGCNTPAAAAPNVGAGDLTSFVLRYGEWDVCDAECSSETAYRPLTCRDVATSLPVDISTCSYNLSSFQALSQPCGTPPCSAYQWEPEEWGTCSAACGAGIATRNVTCTLNGDLVANSLCQDIPLPPLEEICYLEPCSAVSWKTTAWSVCVNGIESRTVTCVAPDGSTVADQKCHDMVGYTTASTRPCNQFQCFSTKDCSNNGVCNTTTKTCNCTAGFSGLICNIDVGPCSTAGPANTPAPSPAAPTPPSSPICCSTGIVDHHGHCCASGIVAGSAGCCPMGSTIDNVGECCPSGKLDACGACNGDGKAEDFLGACCAGEIDAGGLCCPPPLTVDDFGVCGGKYDSGVLAVTMNVFQEGSLPAAGFESFNASFSSLLASVLDVNQKQVVLTSIRSDQTRRKLMESNAMRSLLQISKTIQTQAVIQPPFGSLPYAAVVQTLMASSNKSSSTGVQLGQLTSLSAQGLAGNAICEVGELPYAPPNGNGKTSFLQTGVPSDCQLTFKPVPTTSSGPCNGRGNAVYAQGQCDCWVGYEGQACDICTPGYQLMNGLCQRTYNSFQGYVIVDKVPPSPSTPRVAAASLALPLSLAVVGVATVFAISSVFVIKHKRHGKSGFATTPCCRSDSGGVWAFTDPESGSSITGSSSDDNSRTGLDTQAAAREARDAADQRSQALNSRPLANLVGWLTNHGISRNQIEVLPAPLTGSTVSSGGMPTGSSGSAMGSGLSSETGIAELWDTVLNVEESPKSRRARGLVYTASQSEQSEGERSRSRHMTWTQEDEVDDKAEVLRSPSKSSPSEARTRRSYTYSMDHVSPERILPRRKLHPDFEIEASGGSNTSSVMTIPAAPRFEPVPAFESCSDSKASSTRGLATPQLMMIESAPSAPRPQRKPAGDAAQLATQAFWPRLPWEKREAGSKTQTLPSTRWVP